MKPPIIILDAGPVISLSMTGLLYVLESLKKNSKAEFVVTQDVKGEIIDRPMKIQKYELEAFGVKNLFDKGILRNASDFVSNQQVDKETKKILNFANKCFRTTKGNIELIQKAEVSCLAFSRLCKCENIIVIDERTTRMLVEFPENLKKLMEAKLHSRIDINQRNVSQLKDFKFVRSAELAYVAHKKGLIKIGKSKALLSALLYALKYKGTSISSHEIEEMKGLV